MIHDDAEYLRDPRGQHMVVQNPTFPPPPVDPPPPNTVRCAPVQTAQDGSARSGEGAGTAEGSESLTGGVGYGPVSPENLAAAAAATGGGYASRESDFETSAPETLPAHWAAICPVCDEPTTIISWSRDPIEVPPADHGLGWRVYQPGPTVDVIFADTHEIHGTEGLAWWKGYQATQPQLRQLRRQVQAVRDYAEACAAEDRDWSYRAVTVGEKLLTILDGPNNQALGGEA